MYSDLENLLSYNFKNKNLLLEALTHPSMSFNQKKIFNYERLEFLGDSVLSTAISEYIFNKFKTANEGTLSKKRSILVSKDTLSKIAKKINLGKYIILTKGEENGGGRDNINNLENCMEAIIGAIFLDSSFIEIKKVIYKLWNNFFDTNEEYSYKTLLQEWSQKHIKELPQYILEKTTLIDKREIFTVRLKVKGFEDMVEDGYNIKNIEKDLAKKMLEKIKSDKKGKY